MHTNYIDYIRRQAPAVARIIYHVNRRMCSIHCHKVDFQGQCTGLPAATKRANSSVRRLRILVLHSR